MTMEGFFLGPIILMEEPGSMHVVVQNVKEAGIAFDTVFYVISYINLFYVSFLLALQ
jgi:hypothetical protein